MVGIVLFAHGNLGEGFLSAVELIAGRQSHMKAVGLHHGDGVDEYERRCRDALREADCGQGVMAFVDFLGGTPANTALRCMRDEPFPCVAGVSLPMLLEAVTSRDDCTAQELERICLDIAPSCVTRLGSVIEAMDDCGADVPDEF